MIKPANTFLVPLIACLFAICPPSLMAQRPMIGLEYGYGRSQMTAHGHSFISPFDPDFYTRWNLGIRYGWPVSKWMSVSSGLEYIHRTGLDGRGISIDDKFSHVAIPVRVDFTLGNSFQFLMGPGLNLTSLVAYDLGYYKNHPGFEESKNVVQVNWQLHAGFGLLVTPKTRIYFLYELGFDLTKMYDYDLPNSGYSLRERWYDGILTVGVMTSCMKNGGKSRSDLSFDEERYSPMDIRLQQIVSSNALDIEKFVFATTTFALLSFGDQRESPSLASHLLRAASATKGKT